MAIATRQRAGRANRRRTRKFASGVARRPQSTGCFRLLCPPRSTSIGRRAPVGALCQMCSSFAAQGVAATIRYGVIGTVRQLRRTPIAGSEWPEPGAARSPERMHDVYGGNERLASFRIPDRTSARVASRNWKALRGRLQGSHQNTHRSGVVYRLVGCRVRRNVCR